LLKDCKFQGDTFHDFRANSLCLRVWGRGKEWNNFAWGTRGFRENLTGCSPSKWKRQMKFAKRLVEISKFHGWLSARTMSQSRFLRRTVKKDSIKNYENWSNSVAHLHKQSCIVGKFMSNFINIFIYLYISHVLSNPFLCYFTIRWIYYKIIQILYKKLTQKIWHNLQ